MRHIELETWIRADTHKVFEAITTRDSLDAWWGKAKSAEPVLGHVVAFDHGLGADLQMRITDLDEGHRVVWRCISEFTNSENPASEWLGTSISFTLRSGSDDPATQWMAPRLGWSGDEVQDFTIVSFQHREWPSSARWLPFCADGWAHALTSLAKHCENQ